MKKSRAFLLIGTVLMSFGASLRAGDESWSVASRSSELTVYERAREGSALREVKAVGVLGYPPEVLRRVIDDVDEYPRFMPYVVEARVLSRTENGTISYQRISPPLISDRDYTVKVHKETRTCAEGVGYCNSWHAANDLGPAERPGIARVKMTEGSWLLEPMENGRKTLVTYRIFSDSGGSVPAMIANMASKTGIPKLFEALRKQAKLQKYVRAQ